MAASPQVGQGKGRREPVVPGIHPHPQVGASQPCAPPLTESSPRPLLCPFGPHVAISSPPHQEATPSCHSLRAVGLSPWLQPGLLYPW